MSQAAERWDLSYTQNRELSWLAFDQRVLEEAADPSVPLMERLRFLSIFTSNLDEFFMVRVGSLTDLALVAPNARENKGGFSPAEQLRRIYAAVVPLVRQRDQVYRELMEALAEHGVADIPYKELKNGEREYVRAWYREAMRPLLMPQIIAAECVIPEHPIVSTSASWIIPSFTFRVSLHVPCCGAHQPTPCVKPEISFTSFAFTHFASSGIGAGP